MNLAPVVEGVQEDLLGLAGLGDERSAEIAGRLGDALSSSLRLRLLDLLSEVAVELSSKLPAGHIELRLAGQEPELVFVDAAVNPETPGEELSARISLRLPASLKATVEKAADREGVSTNAWLVRAIARATLSGDVGITRARADVSEERA